MKPANQSDKLTEFYRAWLAWAEGGENVHGFYPTHGICLSAIIFNGFGIEVEMKKQFGENWLYPFDETSKDFRQCKDTRTNYKRLQWCCDHI